MSSSDTPCKVCPECGHEHTLDGRDGTGILFPLGNEFHECEQCGCQTDRDKWALQTELECEDDGDDEAARGDLEWTPLAETLGSGEVVWFVASANRGVTIPEIRDTYAVKYQTAQSMVDRLWRNGVLVRRRRPSGTYEYFVSSRPERAAQSGDAGTDQ